MTSEDLAGYEPATVDEEAMLLVRLDMGLSKRARFNAYLEAMYGPTLLVALRGGATVAHTAGVADGGGRRVAVFTSPDAARYWLDAPDWHLVAYPADDLIDGLVATHSSLVVDPGTPLEAGWSAREVREGWWRLRLGRRPVIRNGLAGWWCITGSVVLVTLAVAAYLYVAEGEVAPEAAALVAVGAFCFAAPLFLVGVALLVAGTLVRAHWFRRLLPLRDPAYMPPRP